MSWEAMEVCMSKTRRGKYTDNRICYISKCRGDMRLYLRRKGKLPCFSYLVRGKSFSFYRGKIQEKSRKDKSPCDFSVFSITYHYFLMVNSNFNPPSGRLAARMVPPCSNTEFFTMASPSPVPPILRLRPLSTR